MTYFNFGVSLLYFAYMLFLLLCPHPTCTKLNLYTIYSYVNTKYVFLPRCLFKASLKFLAASHL